MLKLKSLLALGLVSSALILTACGKKEAENKETDASQQIITSGAETELTKPAIETPADQIDAAP